MPPERAHLTERRSSLRETDYKARKTRAVDGRKKDCCVDVNLLDRVSFHSNVDSVDGKTHDVF